VPPSLQQLQPCTVFDPINLERLARISKLAFRQNEPPLPWTGRALRA
jgi:hypothetical protein